MIFTVTRLMTGLHPIKCRGAPDLEFSNPAGTGFTGRAVARTLIGGGGGCIFIYSGSARLTSFEINFISKETSRARPEYMNIHPPPPPN